MCTRIEKLPLRKRSKAVVEDDSFKSSAAYAAMKNIDDSKKMD